MGRQSALMISTEIILKRKVANQITNPFSSVMGSKRAELVDPSAFLSIRSYSEIAIQALVERERTSFSYYKQNLMRKGLDYPAGIGTESNVSD